MRLIDPIPVTGVLSYRVRRRGRVVEVVHGDNMVVDLPRIALAQLIAGDGPGVVINRIGFGTNGTDADGEDTALTTPYLKLLGGHSYPAGMVGQVKFEWSLGNAEANGLTIQEFGLVCTDDTLFSRKTRNGAIEKDSDVDLEGTWTILF